MNDENFIVIGVIILLITYFILLFTSQLLGIYKATIFFGSISILANMLRIFKNNY